MGPFMNYEELSRYATLTIGQLFRSTMWQFDEALLLRHRPSDCQIVDQRAIVMI